MLSLHSNIWNGHGSWQVRTWLRRAVEAGAILLPSGHHWRSAVIAADLVISDHGSSSCYAAALGRPVLLASFDEAGLIEGSPISQLGKLAPRLVPTEPLRPQVDSAIAETQPDSYQDLAARLFAEPGRALRNLQALIYEMLDLPIIDLVPGARAVSAPTINAQKITAYSVVLRVTGGSTTSPELAMVRVHAALTPPPPRRWRATTSGCSSWRTPSRIPAPCTAPRSSYIVRSAVCRR